MSLIQFLRILVARKLIIIIAMVSCLATALVVASILPPRYKATARVMMDVFKPDPITGEIAGTRSLAAMARTQMELIEDYQTAGAVVDRLGWVNDPGLISAYHRSTDGVNPDIRRWLADTIIRDTNVNMVQNSNILEISYTGRSSELARAIVDTIREVYLASSIETRRSSAARVADWYRQRTQQTLEELKRAEAARTQFAKENNIVVGETGLDLESSKLQALNAQTTAGLATQSVGPSPLAGQVAQLDAQIQQAAESLGPNHPQLQALRRQRAALAAEQRRGSGGGVNVAAINSAYAAQRQRVLAERDKLDKLQQLQRDVDLKRDQYQKQAQREAELRVEAEASEAGLTPLGEVSSPSKPVFPNYTLVVAGATAFGLILGLLVALLVEFVGRRVRSDEDLEAATGAPVLAIVGRSNEHGALVSWLKARLSRRPAADAELGIA